MRRLMRRVAERTAKKTAWEVTKILLKRFGLPIWFWPVLWAGRKLAKVGLWIVRKVVRHEVRKHQGGHSRLETAVGGDAAPPEGGAGR